MVDEKNYEVANGLWIGTKFGDLRRERAALMKQLVLNNDTTVWPRIRELTSEIQSCLAARPFSPKK